MLALGDRALKALCPSMRVRLVAEGDGALGWPLAIRRRRWPSGHARRA